MKKILKILTLIIYAVLMVLAFVYAKDITIDELLEYSPQNTLLAILFVLGLYTLKSVSVFFPIIVLQILSGFLFNPFLAIIINIVGSAVVYAIPYFLGKFLGAEKAEEKIKKSPRIAKLFEKQHKHEFFLTFFLRAISCLPGDLVSMYLGASKFNFFKYLIASMLGNFPGLVPATFMGKSITDPLSPDFITATLITVLTALLSVVVYHFYNKKHKI